MKELISKELLSEVLDRDIVHIQSDTSTIYYYHKVSSYGMTPHGWMEEKKEINIYQLAHKCKEWAVIKGFTLDSSINGIVAMANIFNGNAQVKRIISDTEPEAIFKACQWILNKG